MKIIYAADLHGIKTLYSQLFHLTRQLRPNAIIIGGDMFPSHGPIDTSIKDQRDFIADFLKTELQKIKSELTLFEFYGMMGNDDWLVNMPFLEELQEQSLLKLLHFKKRHLGKDFEIIGYGNIPPTPFSNKESERIDIPSAPREPQLSAACVSTHEGIIKIDAQSHFNSHSTIEEELEMLPPVKSWQKTVYVMHAPPYQSNLDLLYDGRSIGSRAISRFIEKHQPYLTLHGHIHEAPSLSGTYFNRIGKTICINPGHSTSKLYAVVFDLENVMDSLHHTVFDKVGKEFVY